MERGAPGENGPSWGRRGGIECSSVRALAALVSGARKLRSNARRRSSPSRSICPPLSCRTALRGCTSRTELKRVVSLGEWSDLERLSQEVCRSWNTLVVGSAVEAGPAPSPRAEHPSQSSSASFQPLQRGLSSVYAAPTHNLEGWRPLTRRGCLRRGDRRPNSRG
jgi:hypothetical protein